MGEGYKSILKATSIFGGTQIMQILIGLVRSKFVALLIGPVGMGLSSMYMSSLMMMITIFGLGINSSVVRDLSKASDEGDLMHFAIIVKVFRRILYIQSVLGLLCVIAMSSYLSSWAFKSSDKILDYCFLSLIVFFTLLTQGNTAILIGLRKIKLTALCSLIGSIVTLLTSIPFFYFFGIKGIVPGLIVSTFSDYLITYLFVRRISLPKCQIGRKETLSLGKPMVTLGIAMVFASLSGNITTYLINLSITRFGGLSDLGLFNAGMSMTLQSVMLVFSAMSADYYPRLVASLSSRSRMNTTINQQSEILLYLSVPVLALFMLMAPLIISVLLSSEFQVIRNFIRILCLGMLFKAASYALGYVSFAKGDKYVYVFLEGVYGNLMNLALSVGMYYLWGLTGLAYSFVLNYLLYLFIVGLVDRKRYHYRMSKSVKFVLFVSVISLALLLALNYMLSVTGYYLIGSLLCIMVLIYNLNKLNEKTRLFAYVRTKIGK